MDLRLTDDELESMMAQLISNYITRLEEIGVGQHHMTLYYRLRNRLQQLEEADGSDDDDMTA